MIWCALYLVGMALTWFCIQVYCKVTNQELEKFLDSIAILVVLWPFFGVVCFLAFAFDIIHTKTQHLADKVAKRIVARRKP